MRAQLTSYSDFETHRGVAWKATIVIDDTVVGRVEQAGDGGCNRYPGLSGESRAQLMTAAKAWAVATGEDPDYVEILDLYMESLLQNQPSET